MSMNLIKYCFIGLLFFLTSNAFAASWYQVEVVVFDRLYPDLDGEQWRHEEYKQRDNMVELRTGDEVSASDGQVPYMVLPSSRNRLSGVYNILKRSGEYRPLIHVSWQQPPTERNRARFVHIQKLEGEQVIPVTGATDDNKEPEFIESFIQPDRIIDGAIRVRSGYYLHVDVDLSYFTQLPPENKIVRSSEELNQSNYEKSVIHLKETRKVKLNEIHYFDNPLFGVIIQISRLQ